uniref:hypothetical protein n=1 Tax=Armatimonas sp. TaxID=1872638 RepID=UPI0037533A55
EGKQGRKNMTLTIEKPETEARLIRFATSRGISPLEALDELQAMCDGIEAGTIKVTPWDSEAMRKRGAELLKREFGYEAPATTKSAEKAAT